MKDELIERLEALRAEFTSGQEMLADLANRQAELQQTMLRISGAIQVLEELVDGASDAEETSTGEPSPTRTE